MAWVRSERALRLVTISARIASTAPSWPLGAPRARPDCAARAALTASSGSDLPCRRGGLGRLAALDLTAVDVELRHSGIVAGDTDAERPFFRGPVILRAFTGKAPTAQLTCIHAGHRLFPVPLTRITSV